MLDAKHKCVGARKEVITGTPNERHISTSHVKRANPSMRMGMRRFTRLANEFSKKIDGGRSPRAEAGTARAV